MRSTWRSQAGEVFGYLGPNGAGKSTTIAILLGLIRPTSGSARIFDLDVWNDAATIHRRLAHVPSEANLWPSLTGAEVLELLAAIHGSVDTRYREELVDRFELALDKKVRAYSHGNRQKVMLIAALRRDARRRFRLCADGGRGPERRAHRVAGARHRRGHARGRCRGATRVVYGVVIWSLIIDLAASMISGLDWLDRLSLFHYMALAPADDVDPATVGVTLVLAAALCMLSLLLFARRDVSTG